jgi:hypothetical protein
MVLPSKCVAGIEFSDALLYKLLAHMPCVLAAPTNRSLVTPILKGHLKYLTHIIVKPVTYLDAAGFYFHHTK